MVTIKDVAKKAGVAISTVSYALNDDSRVSQATKERILKIAQEMNYHPNAAARNLKRKKTNIIGVFVDGFAGPVHSEILDGIHMELAGNDYDIIVTSGNSGRKLLLERQVDGGIVFDHSLDDELLQMVAGNGLPLILIDRKLTGKNIYGSYMDNEGIVYEIITKMIEKGYKRFGFLSGTLYSYDNLHRFKGFCRALTEYKLPNDYLLKGEFTRQSGYDIGKHLIKSYKEYPDFIYSANDEMAVGMMEALQEEGIKIPEEIAIAGFDNIDLSSFVNPKLTTVHIKRFDWGKQLASAMLSIIDEQAKEISIDVDYKIIYRESC